MRIRSLGYRNPTEEPVHEFEKQDCAVCNSVTSKTVIVFLGQQLLPRSHDWYRVKYFLEVESSDLNVPTNIKFENKRITKDR